MRLSRYRLVAGVLMLSLGTFVFAPAAGALPNAGPELTFEDGACIRWSSSGQDAGLCAFVGGGAMNGTYTFAYFHRWDGATSVNGTFNPLDFHEDPLGTSATLDTTDYNGCRMTFSLQATPATPTDGIQPSVGYTADPTYGFGAGAMYTRDLPASGSGSVCNDSFAQGPSSSADIVRYATAGAAVGAVPNPGAGAGHSGDACIYWSAPSQNAGLCVSVGTGAGVGAPPAGPYSQGFYHWWDGANFVEGVFNPADFQEDPTGTSATLDTTVNGCRLTMSLTAAPATPIDGIQPYAYDYVYPHYGHTVGVGLGRQLPASGSGSICNDAFAQGPGSSAWIARSDGVGAVENR